MSIQINTAAVSASANYIDMLNKKIRDEISEVDSAVRSLENCWEGAAASSCVNKFTYIKRNFSDARFAVVDQFVSLLRDVAGEGYETTEKALISAASAFK